MLRDATQMSKKHFSDRWNEMKEARLRLEAEFQEGQHQHTLGGDPDGEGDMDVDELYEESASMTAS